MANADDPHPYRAATRAPLPSKDILPPLSAAITGCGMALHRATRDRLGNPEFDNWSFAHIIDLRTQAERDENPA